MCNLGQEAIARETNLKETIGYRLFRKVRGKKNTFASLFSHTRTSNCKKYEFVLKKEATAQYYAFRRPEKVIGVFNSGGFHVFRSLYKAKAALREYTNPGYGAAPDLDVVLAKVKIRGRAMRHKYGWRVMHMTILEVVK